MGIPIRPALVAFGLLIAVPAVAQDAPPPKELRASLTPGYVTRLAYSASLDCSSSVLQMMPERATRMVASFSARTRCEVDSKGRLRQCSKDEPGESDLYFATGAALMAQRCHAIAPPATPTQMEFEFSFETTER